MSRKIFNYDNLNESKIVSSLKVKKELYESTISACGCLFYKKQSRELLLISYKDPNWPNYDDLGGIIDEDDDTIYETITREVAEETNGVIGEVYLRKIIQKKNHKQFYNKFCKYFFLVVCVEEDFHTNTDIFGEYESTDNIYRTINWIKYEDALEKLSVRLKKCPELLIFLNKEFGKKTKGFPMGL